MNQALKLQNTLMVRHLKAGTFPLGPYDNGPWDFFSHHRHACLKHIKQKRVLLAYNLDQCP